VLAKLADLHTRSDDTCKTPVRFTRRPWPSLASLRPRPGVQGAQLPWQLEYHLAVSKNPGAHWEAALTLAREIGDRRWEGGLLGNLGGLHFSEGRLERGARPSRGGAGRARRGWGIGHSKPARSANLGLLYQLLGDGRGRQGARSGADRRAGIGHVRVECVVLCNQGIVYDSLGRPPKPEPATRQRSSWPVS